MHENRQSDNLQEQPGKTEMQHENGSLSCEPCIGEECVNTSLTLHEKTIINLVKTYNWINASIKKQFDPSGITVQQYNILRILKEQRNKPATINLLKDRMLDNMSDASRIVERLVQKGFATRKICTDDRRAVDISITANGVRMLEKMESSYSAACVIGNRLKEQELAELNKMLEQLRS